MNKLFQWNQYLIPVLASLLLLNGCNSESEFVDRKWILTSYEQRGEKNISGKDINYQLTFYYSFVKVESNCRTQSHQYLIKNNRLRFYPVSGDAHMDRCYAMIHNTLISSILESGMKYSLEGSKLTLTSYDGKHHKQLIFSETKNYQRLSFFKLLGLQILYMVSGSPYIVLAGVVALIIWLVRRKLNKKNRIDTK
jgi:hypothetical protein